MPERNRVAANTTVIIVSKFVLRIFYSFQFRNAPNHEFSISECLSAKKQLDRGFTADSHKFPKCMFLG